MAWCLHTVVINRMRSRILYICQSALGDIITTLPSIHFIKSISRSSLLDILVSEDLADIFEADPHINCVYQAPCKWFSPTPADLSLQDLQTLFGKYHLYDVVIDSLCSTQTASLVRHLEPVRSLGIGFSETLWAYNETLSLSVWQLWSNGTRTATQCFGDLVKLWEPEFEPSRPVLYVSDKALATGKGWISSRFPIGHKIFAINPGAGHPMKRWPMEFFLRVARAIQADGYIPLFIFGPKENEIFASHRSEIERLGGVIFKSDSFQIQPLAGILSHCDFLLTNDCAVMHVGAAIGRTVLAIFGTSNSRIWFPYSCPSQQVIEQEVPCRRTCQSGCAEQTCMTQVTPTAVLTKVRSMLAAVPKS